MAFPAGRKYSMMDQRVPLEYLLQSSDNALERFALSRLAHAANLKKEIKEMEDELLIVMESAGVAQWLLEHRGELLSKGSLHIERAGAA
jgi:hypothetical protein